MDFRIEKKEAFRIVGVCEPLQPEMEKNFENIPKMWDKFTADGTIKRLYAMMDAKPAGLLGISCCNEPGHWNYFIAAASSRHVDNTLREYMIPAATWAVFYGEGPNKSIQELSNRIINEWLPNSGYKHANMPDIEVYYKTDVQHAKYEVWTPVKKID